MAWTVNTLTLNTDYSRMKSDIADMYGSDVLYFAYDDGRYVGCYDSIDSVPLTDTTMVYEATGKTSNRVY